ncbi:uncharacterized protein F4822DRAFT_314167 [Hypoxylon trugodes]|uniref:uncharacterized protein n=1 Tax=Hypoxylon trugodes TaxID=326681 RepID=UPI0021A0DA63|nr:uncharacterized protein F4822DRAFT_314167 [Hypoxylon trugodes]KAI1386367.1 hypothetical protein F4822DRAFT_314167 [Hypoxylon trugodes]
MRDQQSSAADVPSPLRVIKRGKSMQVLRSSPRKISSESFDSGPDQPLTVVKSRKPLRRASTRKNRSNVNEQMSGRRFEARSRNSSVNTNEIPRFQLEPPVSMNEGVAALSQAQGPITPKCRKAPVFRRTSSLQAGRPVSPTFLTKLRSLSNRRASCSKPGHHGHGSRILSDTSDSIFRDSDEHVSNTSWDQSSYSGLSIPASRLNEFDAHSLSANARGFDNNILDPYLLIPHVSITPESKSLNDGQSYIWTAIEISGQLSYPHASNSNHESAYSGANQAPFIPVRHCDARSSRYGYLYNINVDVLPTTGGNIIDLIGDTTIGTINPGSSTLILACIRLSASQIRNSNISSRDSESLIADLEFQLGGSRIEYVHVCINYCHSGFPVFENATTEDSISTHQTRLKTTVTGVINQHDPTSAWSPKPVSTSNPLFAIIASHWGPARANEIIRRITPIRPYSRRAINRMNTQTDRSEDTIKAPERIRTSPPIPQRQTSLNLKCFSPDPARKIWTELRRTSSGQRPAFHVTSKANRIPAATTFVDAPSPESKTDVQRRREEIRDTATRNRRSIGADSLKSLVPSVAEGIEGKENRQRNKVDETPSPLERQDVSFEAQGHRHGQGRKREGRWSLGGWWQ